MEDGSRLSFQQQCCVFLISDYFDDFTITFNDLRQVVGKFGAEASVCASWYIMREQI